MGEETRDEQTTSNQKRGKFISASPGVSQGCSTWPTTDGASETRQVGGRVMECGIGGGGGRDEGGGRGGVGEGVGGVEGGEEIREEWETEPSRERTILTAELRLIHSTRSTREKDSLPRSSYISCRINRCLARSHLLILLKSLSSRLGVDGSTASEDISEEGEATASADE